MQFTWQRKTWWFEEVEQRLPFWGSELAIPSLVTGLQCYISFPLAQSRTPSLSRGCWNKCHATQASSHPDALHFLRKVRTQTAPSAPVFDFSGQSSSFGQLIG
ncbi:hypothetical protein CHARACLAT_030787 [Characodon lateralis]|uniref:Uncharacterized protein n=1 Tax=Characodon lateralis TaxID=208331 RepID=A0ABU7EI94_9TELE|nr:hypothetical protein [Characodon lateralis]